MESLDDVIKTFSKLTETQKKIYKAKVLKDTEETEIKVN